MIITKKPKFYKEISVLLILMLILLALAFFSKLTLAQVINWAASVNGGIPQFQKVSISSYGCAPTWYDTTANINDENNNNYVGGWGCAVTGDNPRVVYNAIVTFANPADISEIKYIHYGYRGYVSGASWDFPDRIRTYLYYNSQWNLIDSRKATMGIGKNVPGAGTPATVSITAGGPWSNVTKVKIEVNLQNWRANAWWVESRLYEVRALGLPPAPLPPAPLPPAPVYQDIGLRVFDGTEIVAIAAEIGAPTSPLRIAKNGTIYGIALVDPGDPNDSGVRIQTSAGIKALRALFRYSP